MANSIYDDPQYLAMKQEVKAKEINSTIWATVGSLMLLGAGVLLFSTTGGLSSILTGGVSGLLANTGALALGAAGIVTSYVGWRKSVDLQYDLQELEGRRNAMNMARALGGNEMSPQQKAVMYQMQNDNPTRSDGKSWVETTQGIQNTRGGAIDI